MKKIAAAICMFGAAIGFACKSSGGTEAVDPAIDGGVVLQTFPVSGTLGISGLARTPDGTMWAVGERDRPLIGVGTSGAIHKIPIRGVPEGLDLESLAWVGGATLAFGTEALKNERLTDPIYFGLISSTGIELEEKFVFDYGAFSTLAKKNAGVEALCAAGGKLVAASEVVLERRDKRVAPVMMFDLHGGETKRYVVALASEVGKLAGMTCRVAAQGGALEVLAIERHFGVSVVIRFLLPFTENDEYLPSEVVFDFGTRFRPPPNFEGIEWISGEELMLISDNQFRGQSGATQVVRLLLPLHNPAR